MRKKIAIVAVAGGIGLTGGMLLAPSIATAADSGSTTVSGRLAAIKDALKGLVSDGTITQDQADKVATTLDQKLPHRGPGGPGGPGRPGAFGLRGPGPFGGPHVHPEDVATALGLTPQELRTQLESGKTLAQIAQAQGISKATLIDRLVAAAQKDIAADVKAGRLTQAQADAINKNLEARITAKVDKVGGPGPGRRHHHGPDGDEPPAPSGTPASPSSLDANA